ncbi:MAG: DUF998 domain-containing protein [Methanobacterium sp.]|uniref:DUF998 domain-containing protein n=1 Tax=Methanobacterium sp. TaxID=2164 RepID=UPI003D65516F|nr:DUF998 domain-containing protein [Methanobacterium sp.]
MKKFYPIFGIIGPLVYISAVIMGGMLRSDYSFLYNTISELTVANASNIVLMSILFGIYNISILIFGIGAFLDKEIDNSKKYKAATLMLAIVGFLGILLLFFPQDPRNAAFTFQGTMHIAIAGITSLFTLISVLLIGINFRKVKEMKSFAIYSFISFAVILVSGGVAAISVGSNSAYGGLFERITIFAFMIWVLVLSYLIIKKS